MQYISSQLLIFALGLTLAGSSCKSAVYDNSPSAIASASPAPSGTITTTSVVNGAITPEKLSQAYLPLAGGTLTGALTLAGAPTGANDAATKAYVDSAVTAGSAGAVTTAALNAAVSSSTATALALVPAGTVMTWAGTSAPSGYLVCDGTAVSRTTYASLFTAIGITHGSGDGSTTFNLPDYRGRFLRGTDNMGTGAAARDPDAAGRTAMNVGGSTGNAVGSVESDAVQRHRHTDGGHSHVSYSEAITQTPTGNAYDPSGFQYFIETSQSTSTGYASLGDPTDSSTGAGTPRLSNETRPINAYVNYIIKF